MALKEVTTWTFLVVTMVLMTSEAFSLTSEEENFDSLAKEFDPQDILQAEKQLLHDSLDFPDDVEEKRSLQYLPVVFYCTRKTAFCRNGGRGPTVKMDSNNKMPLCVCNCPPGYTLPQCGRKPKSNFS